MSDFVIRTENISKKYRLGSEDRSTTLRDVIVNGIKNPKALFSPSLNDFWALKNISFDVKQGEVLGIIGKNGAGKSTLLKILSRITEPTEGRIILHGRVASLLEVGTGFNGELSGRENIFLNGSILGMTRSEIKRKFDEIVEFSGVAKFLDTPVKRYSSGMYVRLAFAVAAHLEPEILIIDEVLAVGDAEFQKKCLGKMNEVTESGRTVLFVSHNMAMMQKLCQRGILLDQGQIKSTGNINAVVNDYLNDKLRNRQVLQFPDNIKKAQFIKVSINTENPRSDNQILWGETAQIEIMYVLREDIKNVFVGFELFNHEDMCVYTSTDNDARKQSLGIRRKGTYTTKIPIDTKLLKCDTYSLKFYIVIPNEAIIDSPDEMLCFTIHDNGKSLKSKMNMGRRGIIEPIIQWHTEKI